MKRNLFVLVFSLMLLSFGLSFGQAGVITFSAGISGPAVWLDGGVTPTINPNLAFDIDLYTDYPAGGERCTWSSAFAVTGTGVASVTWAGNVPAVTDLWVTPSFFALWDVFKTTYMESWEGTLPDRFNFTGIGSGGCLDAPASNLLFLKLKSNSLAMVDEGVPGTLCVGQGDMDDNAYDWLFDDPAPTFTTTCFPVKVQPNPAPVITNCVAQMTTQHDVPFSKTWTATDDDPISWTANYGTVSGSGLSFAWSFDPPCSMVGQSVTLIICAGDQYHVCPAGTPCTVDLVVLNMPPIIGGDCGKTITLGGDPATASFTATDGNSGDTKTWTVAPPTVNPPDPLLPQGSYSISTGGVLTFDPGPDDLDHDFTFTVTVTDCAGATSSCDVIFHVISQYPFGIKIAKLHTVLQGHHAYVPITVETGSEEMHGFDFLIAYDASALNFMGATAGDMWDIPGAYEWEYFTYRFGPNGNCGSGCPTGMLRVVGIADQNNGAHHPKKYIVGNGETLFTLDFFVSADRTLECMYVPIKFYWMDCGDNTIAMRFRNDGTYDIKTAVSKDVYDYMSAIPITDVNAVFPTYKGANETCFADSITICDTVGQVITCRHKGPIRFIDFYDGAIDIACSNDLDARGDINLNGIANEIGDAVVFTNYFIAGLAAFTINEEGQIQATEVNGDGIVLTVADLVYLIRTIVGDVQALPKVSPYTTTAHFITDGSVVSVDQVLGGVYFVFDGKADVSLAEGASNVELKTGMINGNTVALIIDTKNATAFTGNLLNTNGTIKSVQASDVNGNLYAAKVVPSTFSVRNYPNPFNPSTAIEMALPVASNWTVSVYNVAGQKVFETSGYNEAGTHQVEWNATAQASGIYFYKVDAGKFSATKKMVLLK